MTRCFFLEPTDKLHRALRRYASGSECKAPGHFGCHDASKFLDVVPVVLTERGCIPEQEQPPHEAAGWPRVCACGYVFAETDNWQVSAHRVYRRQDTGEEMTLHDAPPGAMYFADWYPKDWCCGPDGKTLMVRLPNGNDWCVDSRASNCTKPDDKTHKCWVRHGTPPTVTVDKDGDTCAAGAGSILSGSWHGFLRNGILA